MLVVLRIAFTHGMFPVLWHDGTLSPLTSEDIGLLSGHFWTIWQLFME